MLSARLGLSTDIKKVDIDPAKIDNLTKALLSDNLYARLVTDDDGIVKAWLAKKFYIVENVIYIELDENRTSLGEMITSSDVETTLKRLLILDTNSHAKLDKFLKCDKKISKITDRCDSIEIVDNRNIKIFAASETKAQILLKILSATEYGIVPTNAVDPVSLKITSHENTTGAYQLLKTEGVLKRNQYFKSEADYFEIIKVISTDSSGSLIDLFLKNEIDIIPTTINLNKISAKEIVESDKFNIFFTDKIKLFMINFGPRMITDFSRLERHHVISNMRKLMIENFPFPLETEATDQFLSKNGTGYLTALQKNIIETTVKLSQESEPHEPYVFQSYNGLEKSMEILSTMSKINLKFGDQFPPEEKFESRPDAYYMMGDISFDEDYSLLSYYLTNQLIALDLKTVDEVLTTFLRTKDQSQRSNLVNELHLKIINEAFVGPLAIAPYSIITRKPYLSKQSKMSASTKLWLISNHGE